jgi:hypothetical protein
MLDTTRSPDATTLVDSETGRRRAHHGDRLLCAGCRRAVTSERERVPVQGSVEHRFTNPNGIIYDIACFADAPGCGAVGAATAEFTWFAGYRWRIGVCRHCGVHLGWRYDGSGPSFYGLIRARLVAER